MLITWTAEPSGASTTGRLLFESRLSALEIVALRITGPRNLPCYAGMPAPECISSGLTYYLFANSAHASVEAEVLPGRDCPSSVREMAPFYADQHGEVTRPSHQFF